MTRVIFAAAMTMALAGPAAAMDVAAFLKHADALETQGVRAMFSGDAGPVMNELTESNKFLRAERLAAAAAGKRPAYCPDPDNPAKPGEIFAALRGVPVQQRATTEVRDALRAFYAKRTPCRN